MRLVILWHPEETANSGNTTAGGNVSVSVANATQGGNVSIGNTAQGGNVSISSVSTSGNVNSHTLSINEIPSHNHTWRAGYHSQRARTGNGKVKLFINKTVIFLTVKETKLVLAQTCPTSNAGGNGGHSHGFSGSSHNHNASFSGSNHNHNHSQVLHTATMLLLVSLVLLITTVFLLVTQTWQFNT